MWFDRPVRKRKGGEQVEMKSALDFKDFLQNFFSSNSLFNSEKAVLCFDSGICDWSAYMSYVIQPIRAQIDFNPPISDVRINYLNCICAFK